jgi:hypothetical protein
VFVDHCNRRHALYLISPNARELSAMTEAVQPTVPLGIYTHIEKTAGTSVREVLEKEIGTTSLYLYSPIAKRFVQAKYGRPETSPLLNVIRLGLAYPIVQPLYMSVYPRLFAAATRRILQKGSIDIPDEARVIFGHFRADQLDALLKARPTIRAVTIREPLCRLRSHYDHWRRTKGQSDWRRQVPYDPAMTFEDFATLPQMQNFQTQALGTMRLQNFDVVGVTESIEQSIACFFQHLLREHVINSATPKAVHMTHYNRTPRRRMTNTASLSSSTLTFLRKFHVDDYELYAQAKALSLRAEIR